MKKLLLFVVSSLLVNTFSFSQWEKIADVEDNLEGLYELNADKIIAVGSNTQIYDLNSDDPSQSSDQLTNFGFITSLLNISETESYLGGGCYFTFDECPGNTLYKTDDNGESWQELFTDVTFEGIGNILGIIAIDLEELLLISEYNKLTKVNISTGEATTTLIPGTEEVNTFRFGKVSQSGKWLVAASFYDVVSQNTVKYYESVDRGLTWQELNISLDEEERVAFIDYLPNNNLALISNKGNAYTIVDGVMSLANIINDVHQQIRAQYIINDSDWYVASYDQESNESRLHLSMDGGQTWVIERTFDDGFIIDLSFVDRNNGFLILNYNELYKRTGPNFSNNVNSIEVSIYPNPVDNFLTVDTEDYPNVSSISILDAMGRIVKNFDTHKSQYDASNLLSGYYQILLSTSSGEVIAQESFIKQ